MSAEPRSIDDYFPTEPWLEQYRDAINASEEVSETGADWGVGWNGEMVFHIEDLPLNDRTVGDLPEEIVRLIEAAFDSLSDSEIEEIVAAAPKEIRDDIHSRGDDLGQAAYEELLETTLVDGPDRMWPEMREATPELLVELIEQLEENLADDATIYAWLDLYDGACRTATVLEGLDEREHGFVLSGAYTVWKDLVNGQEDVINLIMSGRMELDGDMQKILQYSDSAVALTDVAADTDARFLF
ncbi:SCP2 sterol-binding domain-containing protein [Halocatena salina]|uniref:SCP2 sterol-binding domain-containing protein n=1 Tax=Halocatena salina TaxID=2934340 RepID=A0A8U0A160_9EURY|nr:SCP2 sterol-binding domain-containing protein [Halocatena salina]UPM42875.1 SCP2 sterol-binding domain-containing protein [Halocatena salina]